MRALGIGMRALGALGIAAGALISRPAAAGDCTHLRPTDPGGYNGYVYDAGTVASYGTSRVLVWYATSGTHAPNLATTRADGVPDDVAHAAEVTDDALAKYAAMGFRPPVSDGSYDACASNGGDGRLDVYLMSFTAADGETVAEQCESGGASIGGDAGASDDAGVSSGGGDSGGGTGTASRCASYILAEAKPHNYPDWDTAARTILPHEAFHTVQNAYDAGLDRFWAEGTAQWAAKGLDPALLDLERNLPAFFSVQGRSLDAPAGAVTSGYLYGAAIWPVYLTSRFGADVVREVLEREASTGGPALAATDVALSTKHQSALADAFTEFSAWNVATGNRAGTGGYANAATYPQVALSALKPGGTASGITSGLDSYAYAIHAGEAQTVSIETTDTRNRAVVVPLESGHARLDQIAPLPATVVGDAIVVVAGITAKKTDAPYTLHADALVADAGPGDARTSEGGAGADGGAGAATGGASDSGCAIANGAESDDDGATPAAIAALAIGAVFARRRRA